MARRVSELIVGLIDRVSAPARKVSESLGGISRRVEQTNSRMGRISTALEGAITRTDAKLDRARGGVVDAIGAFYALKGAIAAPVAAAMEFESAMADVKKVVDFDGAADLAAFEKGLLDMTKRVPVAVDGLAQIAAAAGQAGIAKDDILAFTEAAAQIGVAFDISADEAGDAMAKLMTGLGMTLDQATLLTDAMNHLSNAQASSASEILDVVRRVGAMGKQYGFTAEQTAAFGSAMISAGAQSDVAATSFMNMGRALTRGASATKRQREAYKTLGMDAETVAKQMQDDAVGTTVKVMEAIAALPAEMRAAVSSDLFGDEARALGPLLTNLGLVRESLGLVADQSQYAGSALAEYEVRAKTAANRMALFRNSLKRVAITLGNALLPILTDLMDRLEPVIDAIGDWITQNPKLVAGIVSATAAVIAFRGAVSVLRFAGLLGTSGALHLMSIGLNTVGKAGASIGAAVSNSVALTSALGRMSGQKVTLFDKLGAALRGLAGVTGLTAVKTAIMGVASAIGAISAPVWITVAAAVAAVGVAWKYWDRISATLSGVGQALGEILAPAIEAAKPYLEWLAPVGEAIGAGWEKAKAAVAAVGEWLGRVFTKETLTEEDKAKAKQAGYDFVMSLWDGMKQVMADLQAWISAKADAILAPFSGLGAKVRGYFGGEAPTGESVSAVSEFGGGMVGKARGGPISRGATYLTGERGPELITASRSGYVHNAAETARMGGGSPVNVGGITINAAPGQSPEEIARAVMRKLEAAAGSAFRGVQADTGVEAY